MQDDRDRVESSLPNAVVRLFRIVNRIHNRAIAPTGVSAEQAHILSILWAKGPMSMGKLQRQLALSSATLTGAVDRLEQLGLVQRAPLPTDARAVVLEPRVPPKQRAAIDSAVDEAERQCFGVLTAAERKQLSALLGKCIAHLEPLA
jgi:MarR family transcriptional regulator, organic hydroperoxide resistance regulator